MTNQSKKGRKHEERVNARAHDVVRRVRHGDAPAQVPHDLRLERAELRAAQPLRGVRVVRDATLGHLRNLHQIKAPRIVVKCWLSGRHDVAEDGQELSGEEIPEEEQRATDEAQAQHHFVFALVLGVVGQRAIDDVTKVWLQADVEKAEQGQHLIHPAVACRVSEIRGNCTRSHGQGMGQADFQVDTMCVTH